MMIKEYRSELEPLCLECFNCDCGAAYYCAGVKQEYERRCKLAEEIEKELKEAQIASD